MIYTKNTSGLFFARLQSNIYFSFIFFLVMLFIPINLLAQVKTGSFVFEGRTRNYLVFLPQNYNETAKMPVVFNLHGDGGNNQRQLDYSQMNIVADTAGFIVVYPNGVMLTWRYGVGGTINDVCFISALIDTLDRHYSIDLERIYACGFSSGGCMSYKLACLLSQKITAIATVAIGISDGVANNNDVHHPMPVLSIHGTEDRYDTGWPGLGIWPPEQTVSFWADLNSCSELDTISIADLDTTDGCTVEKITYGNGTHSSRVLFYKVIGGGHTWPDAAFNLQQGRTTRDINANVEIWNFFKDYKLSQLFFQHDLMVKSFPLSNLPILANNIQPIVEVKNYGWNNEFDITITCEIDSAGTNIYSEFQTIDSLKSLEKTYVTFQNWRTFDEYIYGIKFRTHLSGDENELNDTLSAKIIVSNLIDNFETGFYKWHSETGWGIIRGFTQSGIFNLSNSPQGAYENNLDCWAELNYSFDLSQLEAAHISLLTKHLIEKDRDFGYLEVSTDNGNTWQQVGEAFTGIQAQWIETGRSLTEYCKPEFNDVRMRFHFISDSTQPYPMIGWYIDDVAIYPYELGTSVSQPKQNQLPQEYVLYNNYPNPFNSQTVIEYQVPEAGHVRVSIYNLLGQRIITLADKKHQAGRFNLIWNGKDSLGKSVPSGVYFYKMEANGFTKTKKMLLLE